MKNKSARENNFVGAILPWLVAASGLILYLATLNHWLSPNNITQAGRTTGQLMGVELYAPLYFLVTYPLHWVPARWVPLGLNILSAVCAASILGLLARSVALLPRDRTHDQRIREDGEYSMLSIRGSWIPPVLAAMALGLQLTLWEGATSGMKDLLDLLLFAYVIRCLLEYRISERDSWLFRAALAYSAGMTGNWVFIGFFPVFIFSLVWIRGLSFFRLRFLQWMMLCGLAGLLLYLVLPAVYVNSDFVEGTFWQALKTNLKSQKEILSMMTGRVPGNILLLLALTSLLPVLLMGIRWASYFGDPSPVGITLTTGVFHLSHGVLLGACVWAAFDPAFGPRHIGLGGVGLVSTLIYLGALSIGYFSGYFLLVFHSSREQMRRSIPDKKVFRGVAQAAMWALLLLLPAGLVYKNLPRIRIANGESLARYASQLAQNLPDRAVVLSDDPIRLFLARAWMDRTGKAQDRLYLETQFLPAPFYFNQQQKLRPEEWLAAADPKNAQGIDPRILIQLLLKLSEKRPIYYLQPSFGYYFEYFHPVPHGVVYEMRRYDTNSITSTPLTELEIAENETFWKQNEPAAKTLLPFISDPSLGQRAGFRKKFLDKLHITFEPTPLAIVLGSHYSLALNFWGVQSQIAGKTPEAGRRFDQALAFNPYNISAQRNLEFNKDLQAGVRPAVQDLKTIENDFGKSRNPQLILREGGPFDDPTHRFVQGLIFGQSGLYRQAVQQFERIAALVPDYLLARFWLAQFYVANRFPEKALALLPVIRDQIETTADPSVGKYDLLKLETMALFSVNRNEQAEQKLREEMEKYPKDLNLLALVFQVSASYRSYTNALIAVDHALEMKPDDVGALVNKGFLAIQLGDFQKAIPALTTALAQETNNVTAKLNRAIAYLGSDQLDEARQDYEALEKAAPNAFQVYYGLGEIAWRKKDTNAISRYYDLYLANAPAGTDEAKTISDRLQSVRTASP